MVEFDVAAAETLVELETAEHQSLIEIHLSLIPVPDSDCYSPGLAIVFGSELAFVLEEAPVQAVEPWDLRVVYSLNALKED